MAEEGQVIACHTLEAWNEQLVKGKESKKLNVVDFTASWCGPCKFMSPVVDELAKKFTDVDVDELKSVAEDWRGNVVDKFVGANKVKLQQLTKTHATKLLEARIDAAVELRRLLGLPSARTNAYRLVNSEGDRPSAEILKEEGIDVSLSKEQHPSTHLERIKVMENGISYAISSVGQKTGFYADQRENRHFISTLSYGQKVLDICCYSGGFALNAAFGGATEVTGVNSSLPALELARENIILNNLDPGRISFGKEDATQFVKGALSRNESWDIFILDPRKLAPSK
ncbi:hypothetical protein Tsubulata_024805, partial [Turnera subulata]